MTPPKVDKVDVRPLETLYLENFQLLEAQEVAAQLRGSDLTLDSKTGELRRLLAGGETEARSLEEEAAWVQLIREGDTNGDKFLDLAEAKQILTANLAAEQASGIEPEKFLASIAELMKNRYAPISANMKTLQSRAAFGPTLEAIKLYNRGIHADEVHMAHRTFALNGLGKTATNIVGFLPSLARNIWTDSPLLIGDSAAESAAEGKFLDRQAAIGELERVIDEGIRNNESWALEGKLEEAMKKLGSSTRDLLNAELCATELHQILTLSDPKERYSKLLAFAQAERPGTLGYGGGNSHIKGGWWESWWNLSGRRNNLFFAKTIFRFLAVKAATQDPDFDDSLDKRSRAAFSDMLGDGGGFGNMAAVGLTNVFCLGGAFCEPTQYRDWSDEAAMDGLGRGFNGALMVWGARRAFNIFGEANRLRQAAGLRQVASVWTREASIFRPAAEGLPRLRPFGGNAWAEAANAAEKEAEILGQASRNLGTGGKSRFGRLLEKATSPLAKMKSAAGNWLFKGMPALSEGQLATLKKAGSLGSRGMGKLVRGVLILGIVQYSDQKLAPVFNPFEYGFTDLDREADFDPYPNLTKPAFVPNTPSK